ncbi:39S ribosomal protein L54 mitochondrial [Biomphalaria pfeifferi]|uniref:Large ribosomal subunit protein mL54 n=1 Tax=Biomphalaria pfeifferi TaxID=112525 RepID=A0AAD8CCB0_BIOPF|nr:39S ribosomal protein L54 mitochondrial [Biomphalaria pfeifferi]
MSALFKNLGSLYRYVLCRDGCNVLNKIKSRSYAKKIVSKVGAQAAKKTRIEVETDPEKLLKYCCGANIYIEGKDPELKPDSEYPDWLWNLRIERGGTKLSELNPETPAYWKRLSRINYTNNIRIKTRLQRLKAIQYPDDNIP